ncbi:hypothetical protein LTR37_020158 [Vermiconidia calcicola]|uniref:Uncharacterized protein n=1 Tax=Vermiconidia calcicola TaxID=1690605 RepID=A0ACC3MC83_9PEZI|nr:hypothetical protein LTR37_020158 [Vermiconidia calcicola]
MFSGFPRPTKQFHGKSYPAISPSRPELSVKGQTVMITGGATGIGLQTSIAFAQAGARKIVILARSKDPMMKAEENIEADYPETEVLTYAVSVTDSERVTEIVKGIGTLDILVLNAAVMNAPGPVLDIDPEDTLENFKVNVFGPLSLVKAFVNLPPRSADAPRTVIYTSSAGIQFVLPGTGAYNASKSAMTYLIRCIHEEHGKAGIRSFAFHPAFAYTDGAKSLGLQPDQFDYDSTDLPAHYAVWLCSAEADFLKGRFVWAHWDVEELQAKKEVIVNDPSQLRIALVQDKLME